MLHGLAKKPYLIARELRYDPDSKQSEVVSIRRVETKGRSLMAILGNYFPCNVGRKPYHYTELVVLDQEYREPLPPLSVRTIPYANPLRSSDMLALHLFLYGDLSIAAAARGTGLSEASIRSSAAALTRKELIQPVGQGTTIRVKTRELLRDALLDQARVAPWVSHLLMGEEARRLFVARRQAEPGRRSAVAGNA